MRAYEQLGTITYVQLVTDVIYCGSSKKSLIKYACNGEMENTVAGAENSRCTHKKKTKRTYLALSCIYK